MAVERSPMHKSVAIVEPHLCSRAVLTRFERNHDDSAPLALGSIALRGSDQDRNKDNCRAHFRFEGLQEGIRGRRLHSPSLREY